MSSFSSVSFFVFYYLLLHLLIFHILISTHFSLTLTGATEPHLISEKCPLLKMWNFLLIKDVRKILKRKDSDAGETGRTLEDLRASLFNEFHSSEGAKRPQKRTSGPAAALFFNFLVAVGIIFMNKMVLQTVKFKFPILLSLIHYVVSWFLMAILNMFSLLPASSSSKTTHLSALFSLGFVMSLSTGLANVSLKYNSIGFYQMAKIAVTPSIVMAEFILYRKKVSWTKALALTVVSIGVAVATVTDLQFHLFGACVASAWIVPSAVNKILWSRLQQQEHWTALALMWKTTPITLIFLAAMIPWLDPPGVFSFDWNLSNMFVILSSAILGFLLQWSGALALGATSPLSHVVLGQFKTCIILLGNYYLFGSNPGIVSIFGACTAIAGMSVYTYLNLKQHSNKIFPGHTSTLPKSKHDKENGCAHDGHYRAESV
ncbi:putative sugar phosphate transporter domain-containing protein [Lupinus albus]|uniref:Putative sugar phosphate transporter domain-containing protein n=1 Tax=Lupinus albus TaxID=3870 RepID=A0A6A4PLP1_LUPAL|nr:putative sugar phosphate transporter domain-containing protein [Lupinus albus]